MANAKVMLPQHLLCEPLYHFGNGLPARRTQGLHLLKVLRVGEILAVLKKCLLPQRII